MKNNIRDTKLRMSIDPSIIAKIEELAKEMKKATAHMPNAYQLSRLYFNFDDGTGDQICFNLFSKPWSVYRMHHQDDGSLIDTMNSWRLTESDAGTRIETYGKMCVDINREIEPFLEQAQVEIDLIREPVYCPVCEHCGETGCCGFETFFEKHVRGKTNCIYETQILNDLEEILRERDNL